MQLILMLLLDNIAELIVGDNLVELSIGHFNKELDALMIGSIVVDNLTCHGGPKFASIIHVSDEGESKKLIRTKMRKLEAGRINIETREVRGGEEDWIARLPRTGSHTEIRIVGVVLLANSRPSNELLCIVGEDLVGECVTFCFGDTDPATRFLTTLRRKGVVLISIENFFKPVKVQERRDIRTLASSLFDRRETVKGRRGKVIH
jgi:hypothetical protein